jgi:dTDP-4-amino-4,6-dideoxygalactose transaminase
VEQVHTGAVAEFEKAFAQWLGAASAFAFWKGRVALYAILRGLGVGEGDEVILPGYTCVMNVNPVKYVGARPIYVDIEPLTYNINPRLIEPKITARTKVIIAQHTYGYPCEMDSILATATRRGIPVVEDCCLALGSRYKGKVCGTFGSAAYFSFQWNKPFTTGLGGMAVTSDPPLAARIRALCQAELQSPSAKAALMLTAERTAYRLLIFPRTTARAARLFQWLTRRGLVIGSSGAGEYEPKMAADFFMQMSAGQARAGLGQMRHLSRNLAHRRAMHEVYDRLLAEAGMPVAPLPDSMDPVLVRYPVRVADKDRAVTEAPHCGVELGTWFEIPLHPKETPMEPYDYREGMCPVAEQACREAVNLPMHPRAGLSTARRSVEFIALIGSPPA